MKSNFDFLNRYWPALAQIGATAENYVYSDPNIVVPYRISHLSNSGCEHFPSTSIAVPYHNDKQCQLLYWLPLETKNQISLGIFLFQMPIRR